MQRATPRKLRERLTWGGGDQLKFEVISQKTVEGYCYKPPSIVKAATDFPSAICNGIG